MRMYKSNDQKKDQDYIAWQVGYAKIKKSKKEKHDFFKQRAAFNLKMHRFFSKSLFVLFLINCVFVFLEASVWKELFTFFLVMNLIVFVAGMGMEKAEATIRKIE